MPLYTLISKSIDKQLSLSDSAIILLLYSTLRLLVHKEPVDSTSLTSQTFTCKTGRSGDISTPVAVPAERGMYGMRILLHLKP